MIIKSFIEPPIENNNYLIIDEDTHDAVLIDCSNFSDDIQLEIKKNNANLKYVLLTHGHFDHITGLNDLPSDVKVFMHKDDMEWISELNTYLPMIGMPSMEIPTIHGFIQDNEIIKLGNLEIKTIHTPGHTKGGVCFLVNGNLFSGDTIFRESIGRCDLPGGDFNQIISSIEQSIFTLPEETVIYPGHGQKTTVAWEKEHNSYF